MISLHEEDFEREVKIVVVGNGSVGKTSMIRQFCKGQYPEQYRRTIGVDFLEKEQFVKGLQEEVKLMLWDTAGQEAFDSMTRSYYRGAKGAVLCFSTIDRASFEAIKVWKQKVEEECGKIPMVLVQNKVDLLDQAAIEKQEAEDMADMLGVRFYRICVKQNLYVTEVFEYLAEQYLHQGSQHLQTPRTLIGRPVVNMKDYKQGLNVKDLQRLDFRAQDFELDCVVHKSRKTGEKKTKKMSIFACSIL